MKATDILNLTKTQAATIEPHRNIREAIRLLAEIDRGALVAVDRSGRIQGILTERDILRAHAKRFDGMRGFTVSDLMSKDVVIGLAEDSLECLMATMTESHIRHLPIMDGKKLLGVLSMQDLVAVMAQRDQAEIRHLKDYISGNYPN
jgi:CBS domain-containing protein